MVDSKLFEVLPDDATKIQLIFSYLSYKNSVHRQDHLHYINEKKLLEDLLCM